MLNTASPRRCVGDGWLGQAVAEGGRVQRLGMVRVFYFASRADAESDRRYCGEGGEVWPLDQLRAEYPEVYVRPGCYRPWCAVVPVGPR